MNTALQLVEPEEIGQKGLTYAEQVAALPPIKTAEEYLQVDQIWKAGKGILAEISEGYDDLIKAAHKLHKDAIAKKDKYYKPAEAAVKAAKGLMSDYDLEQERIRKAEEDRLRKEAEKREEEERIALALEAEQNGQHEEAEAIIEAPVFVAPVILPKSTPKTSGGAVFQTRWFASVTDLKALCRAVGNGQASTEYVMGLTKDKATGIISSPALNSRAVSDKSTLNVPGVQALSRRV